MTWIGLDAGTSSVKAARYDETGTRVAEVVCPVPAPQRDGERVTQDLNAILQACDQAVAAVRGEARSLAFTTQRDTLLLDDELLSWMDGRAGTGSLWDVLDPASLRRTGSLVSALTTHWTGHAIETPSTWPRRLLDEERRNYDRRGGPALPVERPIGAPAGSFDGLVLYATAGDKNCELLAQNVVDGHAGISLGSAVTLGMTTSLHRSVAGVIPSCSARAGHIDLETGLLVGMAAWPGLSRWLPMEGTLTEWVDGLYFLPHFMGALDQPATPALIGLQPDTDPARVATAWAQGLVAELVRLRPALEEAAGHPINRVSVSGGPSEDARWMQLLADAFDCSVYTTGSRFVGCRGAVDAVRSAQGLTPLPEQPETCFEPVNAERFHDWHDRWLAWFDRLTG